MKNTLNMVVYNAIEVCKIYEYVFSGEVLDIYEFPDRPSSNEANIIVGNMHLRLIDENKEFECFSPNKDSLSSIWFQVEVLDVESTLNKAVERNMVIVNPLQEHLGQKFAEVSDGFGYTWVISQTIREVSYEERMEFYNNYHSGLDFKKD